MIKKGWSPLHGIVCLWSGTLADIPDGWAICNGTNGTPDLRSRMIYGVDATHPPHHTGGTWAHSHNASSSIQPHSHSASSAAEQTGLPSGTKLINSEPDGHFATDDDPHQHLVTVDPDSHNHTVTVSPKTQRPPYYALAFIMKL